MPKTKKQPEPKKIGPVRPAFDGVIGQEGPRKILQALRTRDRIAHAYLFTGPDAVGKRTVAIQFARTLLCTNGGNDTCEDCRRVEEASHPNFFFIERLESKKDIAIAQIRELQGALALKPLRDEPRIVLIDEADHLSEEAMNAMLKTLEEPPIRTHFFLITATPSALLDTIRSRCHTIRFAPIPEELVQSHLESTGRDPHESALAARLTGGKIGHALSRSGELARAREKLDEALTHILRGSVNPVVESMTRIRDPKKSRQEAVLLFDLLLLALRESYRAQLEGRQPDPGLIPPAAAKEWARHSADEILARMDILLDHRHSLDRNANVGLAVENALLRI